MVTKLVTVSEMRAIEKEADAAGTTYADMMQKAGRGVAAAVLQALEGYEDIHCVLGLVGSGNNGGDALVALTALAEKGWRVRAYLTTQRDENDEVWAAFLSTPGSDHRLASQDPDFKQLDAWLEECNVLLDGVLGTGIKLPLKADAGRILGHVNRYRSLPLVVAVDCPSGVDCDSGQMAEETIPADLTICMQAVKTGLVQLPAFERVGQLKVVDLGLPESLAAESAVHNHVILAEDVAGMLPKRTLDAHKGTFGTAMVVAGSINYTGAAYLASKAAYRAGAGLVQAAIPGMLHGALAGQIPEATWIILPHELGVVAESAAEVLFKNLGRADAMLIGPGFGMEETTAGFIRRLFGEKVSHTKRSSIGFLSGEAKARGEETVNLPPLVMDADGLKLLAKIPEWWKNLPAPAVLTPHPGEMSVLTGLKVAEIQSNRLETARKYAQEWGQVVVLKGAFSIVAAPDGRTAVIPVATPALARAGTGDVLAGIIVGLRAQGLQAFDAACAGGWIHGQAGLVAEERLGTATSVLASDVLEAIPVVFEKLKT
jgi:hydroxyethylthiazole kinase-like uncharacterized protein yjeF